ncbi:hypothetical protein RSAG8_06355, partial [Rhizoctonia solani AG-8 WAC10335]
MINILTSTSPNLSSDPPRLTLHTAFQRIVKFSGDAYFNEHIHRDAKRPRS